MRTLFLSICCAFSSVNLFTQNPQFQLYKIGSSGAEIFLPSAPGPFTSTLQEDSSLLWSGKCQWGGYEWGVLYQGWPPGVWGVGYDMDEETYVKLQKEMLGRFADLCRFGMNAKVDSDHGEFFSKPNSLTGNSTFCLDGHWFTSDGSRILVKVWQKYDRRFLLWIRGKTYFERSSIAEVFFYGYRFPLPE